MTELIAVIRRDHAAATKRELNRVGCQGYFAFPVLGRGRQGGLRGAERADGLAFLPKMLFDLVVDDEQSAETIEAIIRANQTGEFGDGRIFVVQTQETYRIAT